MALRIYIRSHSPECLRRIDERVGKGEIKKKPTSKELRDYRYCRCGWWMSGTSDSGVHYKQHALKVYSFAAADEKRKEQNRNPEEEAASNIPLVDLRESFLADRRTSGATVETEAIYGRVGTRLIEFCKNQKPPVTLANKVTTELISKLRQAWIADGMNKSTVNYHVGILSMYFRFGNRTGVNNRKLKENVAEGLKPIMKERLRGADSEDEEEGDDCGRTMPLDEEGDENYRKVLAGVEPFLTGKLVVPGRKFARPKSVPFLNDPERFSLLLMFMYETGLRISDNIHTRPEKFVLDNETASYTTMQIKRRGKPHPVTVFFPLELAARIKALKPLHKGYVFYDGSTPWRRFISDVVYRTLHDLGDAVGVEGVRPHRFRDSFAVNRLNEGMLLEQVQILLGHRRLETTRKYYNPWVKSRHNHLRSQYLAARKNGELTKRGVVVEITPKDKRRA